MIDIVLQVWVALFVCALVYMYTQLRKVQREHRALETEFRGICTEFRSLQSQHGDVGWALSEVSWEVWTFSSYIRELWNSRRRLRSVMHPPDIKLNAYSDQAWAYA